MQEIGKLLKECRLRKGLSQDQLAKALFVHRTTVTKIETGEIPQPSYSLVKEWAKLTDSLDMIGMDFAGSEGWKKLQKLEKAMTQLKQTFELVNFMKRKRKEGKHA